MIAHFGAYEFEPNLLGICDINSPGGQDLKIIDNKETVKAFNFLTSALSSWAEQNGYADEMKRFLYSGKQECARCLEILCVQPISIRYCCLNFIAYDANCPEQREIGLSDSSTTILIANDYNIHNLFDPALNIEKNVFEITQPNAVEHFLTDDESKSMEKCVFMVLTRLQTIPLSILSRCGFSTFHLGLFHFERQTVINESGKDKIQLKAKRLDKNFLNQEQETVLHYVCRHRGPKTFYCTDLEQLIQDILTLNVNANQRNIKGQTALMVACTNECLSAVRALLTWTACNDYKLDISGKDNHGHTALSMAKKTNNLKIITMIEQNLYLTAVNNGDVATVKSIHIFTYPTNKKKEATKTYERLHIACDDFAMTQSGERMEQQSISTRNLTYSLWLEAVWLSHHQSHESIRDVLLSDRSFIEGFNEEGQTALHVAVLEYLADKRNSRKLQVIKILLNAGIFNICILNSNKETVLHVACRMTSNKRFEALLEILHEHNIEVNCKNSQGKTALMLACENGHHRYTNALLLIGKRHNNCHDLSVVDNSGDTALAIAKRGNYSSIVKYLGSLSDITSSALAANLNAAVCDNDKERVETILYDIGIDDEKFVKSRTDFLFWRGIAKRGRLVFSTKVINDFVWTRSVHAAKENSCEEILEILQRIDSIVQSQEGSSGNPILHRILHHSNKCDTKELRLIEILLASGKINVNAMNFEARTVLHSVFKGCHKSALCNGKHEDVTNKAIKLILSHGIILNAKDQEGKTPLAIACEIGCAPFTRGLLNWCKRKCIRLGIDAKDRHGQTALIKAALWKHVAVVKLLLNAGASVNLSDNRGFTALHHTLYEIQTQEAWINFGDFPRNLEDFKRRTECKHTLWEFSEPHELYKRNRVKLDEDKIAIIKLLLERADINVNALDCEAYSPLDIAEALLPEIPPVIKEIFIRNGAALSAFKQTDQHSPNSTSYPDYKYEIILHRLCNKTDAYRIENYLMAVSKTSLLEHARSKFSKLETDIKRQMVSAKDQRGRTALHNAIISRQNSTNLHKAADIVPMLIELGCEINETDLYGRTPLHYADSDDIYNQLIVNGAYMTIKDKSGITASRNSFLNGLSKPLSYGIRMIINRMPERALENTRLHHDSYKIHWCQHINPDTIPGLVRTHLSHATNHPTYSQVKGELESFMKSLASYIKKQDPRFEATTRLVGSSYEGTKIDLPDEFDFNFVLTKISQLCEVLSSPELPTGFYRLKRNEVRNDDHNYEGLFDKEIMMIEKLNRKFQIILQTVLTDIQFIDEHKSRFEWNLPHKAEGLSLFDEKKRLVSTLKLKKTTMDRNSNSCFKEISVDIVPCIHIAGWWPDEAISNVSHDIKADGCKLVFDYPQRFYPWVPYSDSCVLISFAIAESETIRKSSDIAKQAFMIGKQLLIANSKFIPAGWKSSYVLKTSLLYCIEAFNSATRQSAEAKLAEKGLKWDFNEMEFRLWLGCLMKCNLDFIAQDFSPCFFMPTFCLPIVEHLKYSHMRCFTDYSHQYFENYSTAYKIFRSTPFYNLDFHAQMPIIDPIFEHFDRNATISGLSESAIKNLERKLDDSDSIEYLYCGGWCESILEAFGEIHAYN